MDGGGVQLFGLARELNYLNTESFMSVEKGIIFNMSVGYSYLKLRDMVL